MKPAPHGIPEPSFGKQGNQCDDDDPADSKDDGGPGRREGLVKVMVDEQFDADAEDGRFRKNIERCGDDGNGEFPYAESKDFRQQGH